ncbi:hypothetical protein MKX01_032933, partial [Papaver californicum]
MPMEYNEYRLVDIRSDQFVTRLGIIAKSVVPPGIKDWKQVSKNMKEEIWNRIRVKKTEPYGTMDRPVLYIATHVYKNIPNDLLHPKHIAAKEVEKVKEIYEHDPNSSTLKHLDYDVVTSVFGRDGKGYVLGIGGDISKTEILASKLKNQGLQTHLDTLEARFNDFASGRQDNNVDQPSTTAAQQ